jgi:hypothetical protein
VRSGGIPFSVPGGAIIPWLALLVIALIMLGLRVAEWRAAALVVAVAMVVYLTTARARRARIARLA